MHGEDYGELITQELIVHCTLLHYSCLLLPLDIYFLDKRALIIGEVGFAENGPLIQRALF